LLKADLKWDKMKTNAIDPDTRVEAHVQVPDAEKLARIKDAIKQTDAIFALEGFEPTDEMRAIDAAVLAGRVTRSQVAKEIVEYAKQHKTIDGFIQSRAWA
jgi:dephospho-CoA kinase